MFNNLLFEYPLFLLIIIPFIFCAIFCKEKTATYYIPHLNIFNLSNKKNTLYITLLKWLIICCAIIALASPYKKLQTLNIKKDGIDIVLSLDTSGSMRQIGFNQDDIEQNRWQAVSSIVKEFIPKRVNDNIGIVVFGTSVMTASPLSFDKNAQAKIIKHLDIGVAGDKTALLDSIAGSINILKNSHAKSKIIIVLTDGEDTASLIPLQVIKNLIKKHNIKIYAIGIGESNKFILNTLAKINSGKAFFATSKDSLAQVYVEIDKLEKSQIEQNKIIQKEYYYSYVLFIAIVGLFLYIYFRNRQELN